MLQGTIHPNSTLFLLPRLQILKLAYNDFAGSQIPDSIGRLESLNYLDFSFANLAGKIPDSIGNLKKMTYLGLFECNLMGSLPSSLFTLSSLEELYLADNMLSGDLPLHLFNHSSLRILHLRNNHFDGEISQVSFQLKHLTRLILSHNNFTGVCNLDTLLSSMPSLVTLDLSYSGLTVVTTNDTSYVKPNLKSLSLVSCKLTMFPESLQGMKSFSELDLSNNEIRGRIPDWMGEIEGKEFFYLNLSHNHITGLPHLQWVGLISFSLQHNHIEGEFPSSICNMSHLAFLDMSYNEFVGVIPPCFGNILSKLSMVNMGNNHFHGTIPNMNTDSVKLHGFIMNGNQLEGDVPSFLSKAKDLIILDIGNNNLNGTFPTWLGNLPSLRILVLRSNNLHGSIETSFPDNLSFPNLQVLDLSHNGLVGHLPQKYFQNFIAMKNVVARGPVPQYVSLFGPIYYSFTIGVKGHQLFYPKVLVNLIIIDLSDNKFEGEIPNVIGTLNSLKVLNLSHNHLNGRIPHALGNLSAIESLDLSRNNLSGEIPQEIAEIASLEVLDLSQNRLVGHIPKGRQFNTFNVSSFEGNPGLIYGYPLPPLGDQQSNFPKVKDGEDGDDEESGFTWKVVMLGYGCGTIIGMVIGYLMLSTGKPKWFHKIAGEVELTILS